MKFPNLFAVQRRNLHLLEHQSKSLLLKYGCSIQNFEVVRAVEQVPEALERLGPVSEWVIKAQCEAGGRGKGFFPASGLQSGVHLTKERAMIGSLVGKMLGNSIVTPQTTSDGVKVHEVSIAQALNIRKERYFAILLDLKEKKPVIVASEAGGVDIEAVAEDLRLSLPVQDIDSGPTQEQLEQLAVFMRFPASETASAIHQMRQLYRMFVERDATMIEINPFASTTEGKVVCFDAKISIDDNAAFRQTELFSANSTEELSNYMQLDGNIGCLVNGAGLAMATLDLLKSFGGEAANFLDVGGAATAKSISRSFSLLAGNQRVKAVFVNVFGGIVHCDAIAQGIVEGAKNWNIPIVVRLCGTRREEAMQVLSSLPHVHLEEDLELAAKKIVQLASEFVSSTAQRAMKTESH